MCHIVIPAKAGIQSFRPISPVLAPGFRRGDVILQEAHEKAKKDACIRL